MSNLAGIVKQLFGNVVARDSLGNERILKVGDELMIGERVVTLSPDAKAIIVSPNGTEITILGNDELVLDESLIDSGSNSNVLADINDLQKSILEGQGLQDLEATAAGGGGSISAEGISLGGTSFTDSGHISNVFRSFGDLDNSPQSDTNISGVNSSPIPNTTESNNQSPINP
ncbi:retention module-containing protein, partial [Campylobacter sp. RM16189]|uniref:retention module-containing protein n=1 Tax=Campylobacter sp. RM16189 TaxID=1705726 RepID=UPI00147380BB